mgnify:FL=1|jgi:hypothetical protein
MVTAAGSAPAGVFVFVKAMLTVLVEAMVPVIIVFVKTALTVLIEVMVPVIIAFVKAVLTVLVKAVSPVVIVFMEAVLTVFFQVLAFLFVMVTEGRGIFSVSAVFFGVSDFSGTGDRSPFFFLQGLMNDRASGIFRID